MRKILVAFVVLFTLGALTAHPVVAADLDTATQIDLPTEEPLMTPIDTPELPELLEPDASTFERKIRECYDWENTCDPGCDCVVISGQVYCGGC